MFLVADNSHFRCLHVKVMEIKSFFKISTCNKELCHLFRQSPPNLIEFSPEKKSFDSQQQVGFISRFFVLWVYMRCCLLSGIVCRVVCFQGLYTEWLVFRVYIQGCLFSGLIYGVVSYEGTNDC